MPYNEGKPYTNKREMFKMKNVFTAAKDIAKGSIKHNLKNKNARKVVAITVIGGAVGSKDLKLGLVLGLVSASTLVTKTALDVLDAIEVLTHDETIED
jgi:hypothetical protein